MEQGLVDAELGKFLYKKRVPVGSKGKRGGARTIIAYRTNDKAYFLYGFSKNEKDNISSDEKIALKKYATVLIELNSYQLKKLIVNGEIIEVEHE